MMANGIKVNEVNMFVKQIKSRKILKDDLVRQDSIEIITEEGYKIECNIDFISNNSHGTYNLFLGESGKRYLVKGSNTGYCEVAIFTETKVSCHRVKCIHRTARNFREQVNLKDLSYNRGGEQYVWVPVEVGDSFTKSGDTFEILAISSNGQTMFASTPDGGGLQINFSDKCMIEKFHGLRWGTPD